MKWILQNIQSKKESVLLGLLGISLTAIGATLLYKLYKKDTFGKAFSRKWKSKCRIISIEYKVPSSSVSAIIGKGGHKIREIELKTGVTINIRKPTKSDTTDRTCIIKGLAESVKLAEVIIQNIIDSVPVIDTFELYVPSRAIRHILGRGRQELVKIQQTSNTKIIVDDSDLNYRGPDHPNNFQYDDPTKRDKKRLIIHGTVEQIERALDLIEQKVQLEDGVDAVLQDLRPIKVPGAYTKVLTDEIRRSPSFSPTSTFPIILSPLPLEDDAIDVCVRAMETPSQFWIQVAGPGIKYLDILKNEMSFYYDDEENKALHVLKRVAEGQVVAARCMYSNEWFRAEVIRIVEPLEVARFEVFLLDYGEFLECAREDLLELRTDMLSLRMQAVECKLANVKPKKDRWSVNACKVFLSCTRPLDTYIIKAKIKGFVERRSYHKNSPDVMVLCVELCNQQNINIGQYLIRLDHAEFDEDLHSRLMSPESNIMKRQFLSVPLHSKTMCLSADAEKEKIIREKNNSAGISNTYNSKTSESKKSDQPIKVTYATMLMEKQSAIVSERKNEANISTNANKNDAKTESKSDNITMSVEEHIDIVPEKRKNEADIYGYNGGCESDNITSVKKHIDIVPEKCEDETDIYGYNGECNLNTIIMKWKKRIDVPEEPQNEVDICEYNGECE